MMNASEVIQLISNVGFPIVCVLALAWYVKYSNDKNDDRIDELNTKYQEEIRSVTEALNNNTLALQRLCDKLGDKL